MHFLNQYNKVARDPETYLITRYGLGKSEVDQIMKYIKKAETKFEKNWS